jgi:hypothetical protein
VFAGSSDPDGEGSGPAIRRGLLELLSLTKALLDSSGFVYHGEDRNQFNNSPKSDFSHVS